MFRKRRFDFLIGPKKEGNVKQSISKPSSGVLKIDRRHRDPPGSQFVVEISDCHG